MASMIRFLMVLFTVSWLCGCHGSSARSGGAARLHVDRFQVLTESPQVAHPIEVRATITAGTELRDVGISFHILRKEDIDSERAQVRQANLGSECFEVVHAGAQDYDAVVEIPVDVAAQITGMTAEYYLLASLDPLDQVGQTDEGSNFPDHKDEILQLIGSGKAKVITISKQHQNANDVVLQSVVLDSDTIILDGLEHGEERGGDSGDDGEDGTLDNSQLHATIEVDITGADPVVVPVRAEIKTSAGAMPLAIWSCDKGDYVEELGVVVNPEACKSIQLALCIPFFLPDPSASTRMAVEEDMGDASDVNRFEVLFHVNKGGTGEYEGSTRPSRRGSDDNTLSAEVFILPPPGNEIEGIGGPEPGSGAVLDAKLTLGSPPDVHFDEGVDSTEFVAWVENIDSSDTAAIKWPDGYYTCVATRAGDPKVVSKEVTVKEVPAGDLGKLKFSERSRLLPSVGEQQDFDKGFDNQYFGAHVRFNWALSIDQRGIIADTAASLPITVLGRTLELVNFSAFGHHTPHETDRSSFGLDLQFAGKTLYSNSKDFGFKWKSDELKFMKSIEAATTFAIGPVPITVKGEAGGELGFELEVAILDQFVLDAMPFANAQAKASAAVDVVVASAGVEAKGTLISEKFVAKAGAGLSLVDKSSHWELGGQYSVDVINDLVGPDVELALFAKWKAPKFIGIDEHEARKVLVKWERFERHDTLLHNAEATKPILIPKAK